MVAAVSHHVVTVSLVVLIQQQQSSVWSTSVAISRLVDHTSSNVTGGLGVAQQLSQEILLAIKDDAVKEKPGTPVVCCNEDTDADLTYVDGYWVEPKLPDENVFFTESHRWIIDHIMKAYNKFVETGTKINKQINTEFEVRSCLKCPLSNKNYSHECVVLSHQLSLSA